MHLCRKCGLPLSFKRIQKGKLCPTNPDGSDHWDLCRTTWLRNMRPEERAAYDLADAAMRAPRPTWGEGITHVYCDDRIPPWDESLGEFRHFTDAEKVAGIVCQPVDR
jgi:hypothetical protein